MVTPNDHTSLLDDHSLCNSNNGHVNFKDPVKLKPIDLVFLQQLKGSFDALRMPPISLPFRLIPWWTQGIKFTFCPKNISPSENSYFHKIHKISFLTKCIFSKSNIFFPKFIILKSHIWQNSHLWNPNFHQIHIFQTANSRQFLDKKWEFAPVCSSTASTIAVPTFKLPGPEESKFRKQLELLFSNTILLVSRSKRKWEKSWQKGNIVNGISARQYSFLTSQLIKKRRREVLADTLLTSLTRKGL